MHHAGFHADGRQRLFGTLGAPSGRHAGIDQWQFHIVQRCSACQQVESLKHESDFLVADAREFIIIQFTDQLAIQPVLAFRRRIQATNQVHQS